MTSTFELNGTTINLEEEILHLITIKHTIDEHIKELTWYLEYPNKPYDPNEPFQHKKILRQKHGLVL